MSLESDITDLGVGHLREDIKLALQTKYKISSFMKRANRKSKSSVSGGEDSLDLDILKRKMEDNSESDMDPFVGNENVVNLDSSDGSDDIQCLPTTIADTSLSFQFCSLEPDESMDMDLASNKVEDESVPYMKTFLDGISFRKLDCNSILVCLEPRKRLYFSGKALIQVVKGKADIFGFLFGPDGKKYTAYSAKGHSSLLCVTALTYTSDEEETSDTGHPNLSLEECNTSAGVLIIMEGFENEWCEGFRHLSSEASNFIGPSITGIGPTKTPKHSTFMDKLGFQFVRPSKNNKLLDFPPYFYGVFNDLIEKYDCSKGRICPFGGQGVGKSTFVKWLTNRYLSTQHERVLFLDLDPGQSEFTPPGMLAVHVCSEPILGPNFSHLKDPIRATYLGGLNVADMPVSYINTVVELVEFCSNDDSLKEMPWVINTMGFSSGLGVHLACEIIKIIRPNCVIQIQIDNDARSFPFLLNKENVAGNKNFLSVHLPEKYRSPLEDFPFLAVKSACNRDDTSNNSGWGIDRKKARKLTLMSYFAEKVGNSEGFKLQSVVPLRVSLNSIAIGTTNSDLSHEEIVASINGNLVALCRMTDSLFLSHGQEKKYITKAGNHSNICFGYGVVRAYDKQSNTIFVITPMQELEVLEKVNVVLAAGAIGIPVNFYISPGSGNSSGNSELPYVMSRSEGTSTLHTATRKVFVPKRVTHSVLKKCLL